MKIDLVGKINNTVLRPKEALLPMFEAVMNSFQAIDDAGKAVSKPCIEVVVTREHMLIESEIGRINRFSITDNGIGFNEENLDSFFTSDTQFKAPRGGKGLGRFAWLKAFEYAEIESHYWKDWKLVKRSFKFTTNGEQPTDSAIDSILTEPKTTVHLIGMKIPYTEHCPYTLRENGHRLVEHFLPFFLDSRCPSIIISDSEQSIDLNNYFRENFASKASNQNFTINNAEFTVRGLRLYNPHEIHRHSLFFAADSRAVLKEKLDKKLPNLQRGLTDDNGTFVYMGFVEGDYLNKHVNVERTSFILPSDGEIGGLFEDISLDMIRDAALECVSLDLQPFLEEINTEKRTAINSFISKEAPQYRPLVRYMDEFINRIPPGTTGHALERALHEQMYEKQRQLKQESHKLIEDNDKQSLKPEEYETKLKDFLERANELGKSSLAEYVIHRKVILDFLEKSLHPNPETGKYPLEEIIHKIIYPMRTTSDEVPYEQQNLWIIDERLSYHGFLASDIALNKVKELSNPSKSRPDIMMFDHALTFAEENSTLNSLVIVEFKKPDRSNYTEEDPIEQVYRLIREIKKGHFKDKNGREIKVASEKIPAYAYVICDTTKEIEIIAEDKGLWRTPDNQGYYGYNPNLSAYVEVISYAKLLTDAKKRNRILFDKLNLSGSIS